MISRIELGKRVELAVAHWTHCLLCEHRCGVNRLSAERGPCKAGSEARVFRHRVEYGEEQELIPSHLVYLSGCDLRCRFCIAEENAFDPRRGELLTGESLAAAIVREQVRSPRTLQFVGGEPTIHVPSVLIALAALPAQLTIPPIVWKSDFHATPVVFDLLAGIVDTYVADFKFGNDDCALRIASVGNYFSIVTRNLLLADRQTNLIVRHLLLPGHLECCFRPLVGWIAEHMPGVKFCIRDGYLPRWQSRHDVNLRRPLHRRESEQAFAIARSADLNLVN